MGALPEGPHEVTVERMTLEVDGPPADAIEARPVGTPLGGLVVLPDIAGVRPLFDDVCRRIATHGLAVVAVEPFVRVPRDERETLSVEDRLARAKDLFDGQVLGDAAGAADHLTAVDGVHEVDVLGFCLGGYYTLKAAATGRFRRAVSFYGMIQTPQMWECPGHRSPLDTAAEVCPTLCILGDQDPWIAQDDIDALRNVWADRDDCRVVCYRGAEHGFVHDPDRPAHRDGDADDAWRRALRWLFED